MDILPAIDLKSGQCVRLTQGDFNAVKIYEADPLKQAKKFAEAGATWLHVVDLDGARDGKTRQSKIICEIAKQTSLKIQAGGGIRDDETIKRLLGEGVERVVIGSLAVKNIPLVQSWLRKFGANRIVLAFDVRLAGANPEILIGGWQSNSNISLWDVLDSYEKSGLKNILCTDVARDGMLQGSNRHLYRQMLERQKKYQVFASGGIDGISDLLALRELNLAGAIVGKAIYEGRIDLAEAIRQVKNAC